MIDEVRILCDAEAFIEHRYNQGKRHKALRESLRLMVWIRPLRIHVFVVKTVEIPRSTPECRACHYFARVIGLALISSDNFSEAFGARGGIRLNLYAADNARIRNDKTLHRAFHESARYHRGDKRRLDKPPRYASRKLQWCFIIKNFFFFTIYQSVKKIYLRCFAISCG